MVLADPVATFSAGREDLDRAAADLAARVPEPLGPLTQLAYNYRWSWMPGGSELFASVDPERWVACSENPVRLLQEAPVAALRRAAENSELLERAAGLVDAIRADLDRPAADDVIDPAHPVAFLCAEYGIHCSLPIYSGGLGALAGDLVKEASDRALPFVAVGLMYRKGYFRQRIDASGWQNEYWIDTDPERLPAAIVTGPDRLPLTVELPIYDASVTARIWRVDAGRVPMFLLDTDCPENGPIERWITARLYVADPETRLAQYALLGIGGVRALRALGIEPGVVHLNEGHAALAPFELAAPALREGETLDSALAGARARTVFTTHTPVPAGNDTYPAEQVERALSAFAEEGSDPDRGADRARADPAVRREGGLRGDAGRAASEPDANAVSARHGEVARTMWKALWPRRRASRVPIGHVTNGVHVPTWVGAPMRELFDRYLGEGWHEHAHRCAGRGRGSGDPCC